MKKRIEEIESMVDAEIERKEHQGDKKNRHAWTKHTDTRVKVKLPNTEVEDSEVK